MSRSAPAPEGVLRSVAWLTVGNVAVKPLWFLFVTAVCMRALGVEGYGVFTATLALAGLLVALTDLGTVDFLSREAARDPGCVSGLFTDLLVGRAALTVLLIGGAAAAMGAAGEAATPLVAAGVYLGALRSTELCRSLYRAFAVLRFEAGSLTAERLLVIGGGCAGLAWLGLTSGAVLSGMAAGAAVSLGLNLVWTHRRLVPVQRRPVRVRSVWTAYGAAVPIGLFGLFTMAYHGSGPILLEAIDGPVAAGQFGAGWRVVEMLMLVPGTLTAVLLPRLTAAYHTGEVAAYRRLLGRSALGLGAATAAIAAGVVAVAPLAVEVLAGGEGFEGTDHLLRLLAVAFPFMSLTMLFAFAMIAARAQWLVALGLGVVSTLHVAGAVVWIPKFGATAVAVGLVVGYAALSAAGYAYHRSLTPRPLSADGVNERPGPAPRREAAVAPDPALPEAL